MKGRIINYSPRENKGIISGEDGRLYDFSMASWKATQIPALDMRVIFEQENEEARNVYIDVEYLTKATKGKSKIVAGVLAICLGFLGAHKFYLGKILSGLVYLLLNTIGLRVTKLLNYIPNYVLIIIAIIEGIFYLTKRDGEFYDL